MDKEKPSPALKLVLHVWANSNDVLPYSWPRLNRSMKSAVYLAIDSGMRFDIGDFDFMNNELRMSYWGGISAGGLGERFYSVAGEQGNVSACRSFESWKDRKPFILERQRVYGGRRFRWEGEIVECTSFQDERGVLIACSYKPREESRRAEVKHKHVISHEDFRKHVRRLREAKKKLRETKSI